MITIGFLWLIYLLSIALTCPQQDLHKIFHAKHKCPLKPEAIMLVVSTERSGAVK